MSCLRMGLLLLAMFFLPAGALAATPEPLIDADLRFVDAQNDVGYYVDFNTVKFPSPNEARANLLLIKAGENVMYFYDTLFNRQKRTYQIMSSIVYRYEDKTQLSASKKPLAPMSYAPNSPMQTVVDYIYHPQA